MKIPKQTLLVNYENNQQDAVYRLIYYSKSDLHVSGDVFAHHQEHLTVFTASGSVHPSCCRLVPAATWVKMELPRRLNFICGRFGTLCLFHLHRQVGV